MTNEVCIFCEEPGVRQVTSEQKVPVYLYDDSSPMILVKYEHTYCDKCRGDYGTPDQMRKNYRYVTEARDNWIKEHDSSN